MTKHLRTNALAVALGLLSALECTAQAPDKTWHQIEVIIFAQQDAYGAEKSPPDPTLSYPHPIRLLDDAEQLNPAVAPDATINEKLAALMVPERFQSHEKAMEPASFVPLTATQRQLNPDAHSLEKNGSYRILFHQAWQQPVEIRRNAEWVLIQGGGALGDHRELEGSLRISHSRFYHVETNLWLNRFKSPQAAPGAPATVVPDTLVQDGSPSGAAGNTLEETAAKTIAITLPPPPKKTESKYLLALEAMDMADDLSELFPEEKADTQEQEPVQAEVDSVDVLKRSDQVRRKQLHYIDHPRMGVLVLVTPLDAEEEDPEDLDNGGFE